MAELVVKNVSKEYPARGETLVVLRDVSLRLSTGQSAAIAGPSGSGKSTLLGIIGTLERPTAGRVRLDDQELGELPEAALAPWRNRRLGFVFQDHYLLPQCSVLENVLLPTVAAGPTTADARDRALMLLDRVGLADRREHRPAELSGGERQRAAIARALVNRPSLLLADEPTGNLDRTNAMRVGQLLLDLNEREQMMLLVVTHSPALASLMGCQWELDDGQLAVFR